MKIDYSTLDASKALSMALKAEKESALLYEKLKGMVANFVVKDKIQFLINEEKKHEQIIGQLFGKMFPGEDPLRAEKSLLPAIKVAIDEENSILDLFEMAMDVEKTFEEFYDKMAEEVSDKGAREILLYLSTMEHGHYSLLKGEFDLAQDNEIYFERGDFEYDMVHIGP